MFKVSYLMTVWFTKHGYQASYTDSQIVALSEAIERLLEREDSVVTEGKCEITSVCGWNRMRIDNGDLVVMLDAAGLNFTCTIVDPSPIILRKLAERTGVVEEGRLGIEETLEESSPLSPKNADLDGDIPMASAVSAYSNPFRRIFKTSFNLWAFWIGQLFITAILSPVLGLIIQAFGGQMDMGPKIWLASQLVGLFVYMAAMFTTDWSTDYDDDWEF